LVREGTFVDGAHKNFVIPKQVDEEADKGVAEVVSDVAFELLLDALLLLLLFLLLFLLPKIEIGVERAQRLSGLLERDLQRMEQGIGQIRR
jgi:hypothetical protein